LFVAQDLAHKDIAIDIDTTCFQLETNSHEIALRPGINQVQLLLYQAIQAEY
jgi:hypothetical protein